MFLAGISSDRLLRCSNAPAPCSSSDCSDFRLPTPPALGYCGAWLAHPSLTQATPDLFALSPLLGLLQLLPLSALQCWLVLTLGHSSVRPFLVLGHSDTLVPMALSRFLLQLRLLTHPLWSYGACSLCSGPRSPWLLVAAGCSGSPNMTPLWRSSVLALIRLSAHSNLAFSIVRDHLICRSALAPYGDHSLWYSLVLSGH